MRAKPTDLEAVLREAIARSELTRYAIAQGAGLDTAQLLRFAAGKRSLTLPAASKLAEFLGLELKPKQQKRR